MPRPIFVVAVGAALAALLALTSASAFAAGPYLAGQTGYDLGWPQCGSAYPAGAFGIVGISHGRPFDVVNGNPNPCLAPEYTSQLDHGMYLSTGYDPIYYNEHATSTCVQRSGTLLIDTAHQQAWAIGCSWAEDQLRYAASVGAVSPVAWWLDVETANSWSIADLTLNSETLQGGVDMLSALTPGIPVGVYSTRSQWGAIAGTNHVAGLAADWVATGSSSQRRAARSCGSSFTGEPVWLVQWVTTLDHDYAC